MSLADHSPVEGKISGSGSKATQLFGEDTYEPDYVRTRGLTCKRVRGDKPGDFVRRANHDLASEWQTVCDGIAKSGFGHIVSHDKGANRSDVSHSKSD